MKAASRRRRLALVAVLSTVAVITSVFGWTLTGQALTVPAKQDLIWVAAAQSSLGETRGHGSALGNSFSFDVAFKKGLVTGSLSYTDGSYEYHLQSLTVDSLTIVLNKASFSGKGLLSQPGQPDQEVKYSVSVEDNGKPGVVDTFRIEWVAGLGSYTFYSNVMKGDILVLGGY